MATELGALLSRLLAVIAEREAPILDKHRLTMWEYVILSSIADDPGLSQNELARRSRRDSTRLIRHLDQLAARGLVEREVDPLDRRRREVTLTKRGHAVFRATANEIRAMEDHLLRTLSQDDQERLRRMLLTIQRSTENDEG